MASGLSFSRRVLIIDDDEYIQELLTLLFESRGITNVETASDGMEGFKKLQNAKEPYVVFLDLMMPVCSGWDVLKKIEENPEMSKHRIAVMSASRPEKEELGDYTFLPKPPDIPGIIAFVENAF